LVKIRVGHATHVGLQRKRNEDSYLVYVPWESGSASSGLDALQEGDFLILCSDGLTGGVDDREILAEALDTRGPQKLAERLVQVANERDGSDNVTVVVVRCENEAAITEEITRPDLAKSELGIP
jgi:serine/threonine protein phosphatase PrpC